MVIPAFRPGLQVLGFQERRIPGLPEELHNAPKHGYRIRTGRSYLTSIYHSG